VTTANTLRMPAAAARPHGAPSANPRATEARRSRSRARHLIPKQIPAHGLQESDGRSPTTRLHDLIRYYTREAGWSNLEREIAKLTRKAIKDILIAAPQEGDRDAAQSRALCGGAGSVRRGSRLEDLVRRDHWSRRTEVGGELLSIEAVTLPGKGRVTATGKLGDVMKESVQAAESYVKVAQLRLRHSSHRSSRSATSMCTCRKGRPRRTGPSAGVAMVTSMSRLLHGIRIRRDVRDDRGITLRAACCRSAASRRSCSPPCARLEDRCFIPRDKREGSRRDPRHVKKGMTIVPVGTVDELLKHALVTAASADEWAERARGASRPPRSRRKASPGVITH